VTGTRTEAASVRLQRTFRAPPAAVFDAWTNPEVLRRWWAAGPRMRPAVAEVDLRVGGHYRLSMEDPQAGRTHTVGGRYIEVRRPERLVYTWAWEVADGEDAHASTVTVDFLADGGGTTVMLEHSGLATPDAREAHRAGWEGCLESFQARVLAPEGRPA